MFFANEALATNKMSGVESSNESIEKYGKLSKIEKLSKSRKSAKLRKKLSKNGNLPNFDTKENESSFLIPNTWIVFNHLWLAFTKDSILQHFDPECHIWIETDILGYIIGGVLSQLTFKTRPDGVVTKTDLSQ